MITGSACRPWSIVDGAPTPLIRPQSTHANDDRPPAAHQNVDLGVPARIRGMPRDATPLVEA